MLGTFHSVKRIPTASPSNAQTPAQAKLRRKMLWKRPAMSSYREGLYGRPRQRAAFPDSRAAANRCPPPLGAQEYIAQSEEANPCASSALMRVAGARA